jgi:hypothetical protein
MQLGLQWQKSLVPTPIFVSPETKKRHNLTAIAFLWCLQKLRQNGSKIDPRFTTIELPKNVRSRLHLDTANRDVSFALALFDLPHGQKVQKLCDCEGRGVLGGGTWVHVADLVENGKVAKWNEHSKRLVDEGHARFDLDVETFEPDEERLQFEGKPFVGKKQGVVLDIAEKPGNFNGMHVPHCTLPWSGEWRVRARLRREMLYYW